MKPVHLLCGLLVVLFATPAFCTDYPKEPISLEYLPSKIVVFPHEAHMEAGTVCDDCHHELVDGKQAKCTTEGCHDVFDRKDKSERSLYQAIHGRTKTVESCVGCHKKAAKELTEKADKKALTSCRKSKCHPE